VQNLNKKKVTVLRAEMNEKSIFIPYSIFSVFGAEDTFLYKFAYKTAKLVYFKGVC
jgi:hypothetical protein